MVPGSHLLLGSSRSPGATRVFHQGFVPDVHGSGQRTETCQQRLGSRGRGAVMGLLVGQEGRAVAVTARSAPSGSSGLGSIVRVERTARLPGRVHGARGAGREDVQVGDAAHAGADDRRGWRVPARGAGAARDRVLQAHPLDTLDRSGGASGRMGRATCCRSARMRGSGWGCRKAHRSGPSVLILPGGRTYFRNSRECP